MIRPVGGRCFSHVSTPVTQIGRKPPAIVLVQLRHVVGGTSRRFDGIYFLLHFLVEPIVQIRMTYESSESFEPILLQIISRCLEQSKGSCISQPTIDNPVRRHTELRQAVLDPRHDIRIWHTNSNLIRAVLRTKIRNPTGHRIGLSRRICRNFELIVL